MCKILHTQDLRCAWILFLNCAPARANHTLRVVHPVTLFCSPTKRVTLRLALSQLVSVPHKFMCCDVAFNMTNMSLRNAHVLVQLGGLFGDDRNQKPSRCRHIVTQIGHEDAGFHVCTNNWWEQVPMFLIGRPCLRVGVRPPGQRIDVRQVIPSHGCNMRRLPHVKVCFHMFPNEPKVEDRVFLFWGVGAPSSLASLLRNQRQRVHKRDAHRCKTFGGCRQRFDAAPDSSWPST